MPEAPPPPAATGGNGTEDVPHEIKALQLPAVKEVAIMALYQRHQARPIRGDDLSEALRSVGISHNDILRVAPLFTVRMS